MVKIKTSEATGAALDWLVANALGTSPKFNWPAFGTVFRGAWETNPSSGSVVMLRGYSTDWAQGGPIIEREKIYCLPPKEYYRDVWVCTSLSGGELQGGDTPLIAAMRGYVASKLGDEVEVPEEL